MQTRYKKMMAFAALLALTAVSTMALAETESDSPTRVGRVSLTQGQVSMSADVGDEMRPAAINWPVTSHNQISTARGARTEVRIGSTAIRLDGDSALEVVSIDDDTISLHLHYGSASIRVRNPDAVRGFRLSTPHGQVRLQEPGRFRVDVDRVPDSSVVNVFDGVALVDAGGSALTLRANRRAEMHQDDVRTSMATRDSFDDWALLRDQRDERAVSERYVGAEMTGAEDLDQHGAWREDAEYGPVWTPRSVPSGWVPYRDGSWTWVSPWGWTWVDNAPWGYAPFHYGRWVMVNQRWCWAPGRNVGRPVWAPALVGWVGGSNWSLTFGNRSQVPAQGWYPLGPRHVYVPGYRLSDRHLKYINRNAWQDNRDGRGHDGRHDGHRDRRNDGRFDGPDRIVGVTVLPHAQFGQRGTIVVPNAPRATVTPLNLQAATVAAPPAPAPRPGFRDYNHDGRDDRGNRNDRGDQNDRGNRNDHGDRNDHRGDRNDNRPGSNVASQPVQPAQRPPVQPHIQLNPQLPPPAVPAAHTPSPRFETRGNDDDVSRRGGRREQPGTVNDRTAPVAGQQNQYVRPPQPSQPQFQPPPQQPQQPQQPAFVRPPQAPQPQFQPPPQQPQPAAMPAPAARMAPPAAAPAAAPKPEPQQRTNNAGADRERRQQEKADRENR